MMLELAPLGTLALAAPLFFIGQFIVRRSAIQQRYSIPVPVVGGVQLVQCVSGFQVEPGLFEVLEQEAVASEPADDPLDEPIEQPLEALRVGRSDTMEP